MGAQTSKAAIQPGGHDSHRPRKLRRNYTDSFFGTSSSITLGKSETLSEMNSNKSPSCINLYEHIYSDIADTPKDFIRTYEELKSALQAFDATVSRREYENFKKLVEDFELEVKASTVFEMKHTLIEKANRLKLALRAKVATGDVHSSAEFQRPLEFGPPGDEFIRKMFTVFMAFTARLDALKIRLIECYEDDQGLRGEAYAAILADLQTILDEVRVVADKGDVRVIVTREEYEDYIKSLKERFGSLVQTNFTSNKHP